MKKTIILVLFNLFVSYSQAQKLDSILSAPQVLELSISTPQPRLNETFQLSIDVNHLRANIFKSLAGKVQFAENTLGGSDQGLLTMNVTALKKGKNEIGPLEFYLDKTKYTTNKISYEVIDTLPDTDRGLWFRKVMTNDSTVCIIIEQRIPASTKTTKTDNSISMTTEPEYDDIVRFKDSYSIEGLQSAGSHTRTNFSSVEINGEEKQFMYGYSVYYFTIIDRKAKISLTKDKFDSIPAYFRFEDILIQ